MDEGGGTSPPWGSGTDGGRGEVLGRKNRGRGHGTSSGESGGVLTTSEVQGGAGNKFLGPRTTTSYYGYV